MSRTLAVIIIASAIYAPAHAQNPTVISGFGSKTCSEFAQDYRADPRTAELAYFTWAQGFMSALNINAMSLKKPVRDLSAKTVESQQSEIRRYCDERPLKLYLEAASNLFGSLPLRRTPQSN